MFDQTKKASHIHNISKFMSLKNDAIIRTQSMLEFDFCFHLEFDSSITSFKSQPLNIYYSFKNRKCRYTPDFEAIYDNSEAAFFEVKHSSKIHDLNFRKRFKAKQEFCLDEFGKRLLLITERQIRTEPFLSNAKLIQRYSGSREMNEYEINLLNLIKVKQHMSLRDAISSLSLTEEDTIKAALALIGRRHIHIDIKKPLDNKISMRFRNE